MSESRDRRPHRCMCQPAQDSGAVEGLAKEGYEGPLDWLIHNAINGDVNCDNPEQLRRALAARTEYTALRTLSSENARLKARGEVEELIKECAEFDPRDPPEKHGAGGAMGKAWKLLRKCAASLRTLSSENVTLKAERDAEVDRAMMAESNLAAAEAEVATLKARVAEVEGERNEARKNSLRLAREVTVKDEELTAAEARVEALIYALRTVLGDATHGQNMTWTERCQIGRRALSEGTTAQPEGGSDAKV